MIETIFQFTVCAQFCPCYFSKSHSLSERVFSIDTPFYYITLRRGTDIKTEAEEAEAVGGPMWNSTGGG